MPVIGYRYLFGMHMGIGKGPLDEMLEVRVGDRPAWRGSVVANGSIFIDAYNLFGGESGEGGIYGTLDVMMGEDDQVAPAGLASMLGGGDIPGFRRAVTMFFDGVVSMMNPYPKPWKFRIRRVLKGWDGSVWHPELAAINLTRVLAPSEVPTPIGGVVETTATHQSILGAIVDDDTSIELDSAYVGGTFPDGGTIIAIENVAILLLTGGEQPTIVITPFDGTRGYELIGTVLHIRSMSEFFPEYNIPPVMLPGGSTWTVQFRYTNAYEDTPGVGDTIAVIRAMNPAHIIYEALTNREWGRGLPRALLDDASFLAAAQTLYTEGLGMCIRWSRKDKVKNFIKVVLDHIGAVLYTDRRTALLTLKLLRADYTFNTLPVFDTSTGILEISSDTVTSAPSMVNEMVVTYHDPVSDEDRPVKVQNLASLQASNGSYNSQTRSYLGAPTPEIALRLAQRDLRALGVPLRRYDLVCDRRLSGVNPGDVIRIRDNARSIPDTAVRVGKIQDGSQTDGKIVLTVVQDAFSTPRTSYAAPEPSGWVPPSTLPCLGRHKVFEMPYIALLQQFPAPDFALIDETSAYVGVVAERGASRNASFTLAIREEASTPDDVPTGTGYFCGYEPTHHRYWRLKNFTGADFYFETNEMQLIDSTGAVVSAGVTPIQSDAHAPDNDTNYLTDGNLVGSQLCQWSAAVAGTLTIDFDLATPRFVVGARISRYGNDFGPRFPTACTLAYSDNGTTWTDVGTGAITMPAWTAPDRTLSNTITFG